MPDDTNPTADNQPSEPPDPQEPVNQPRSADPEGAAPETGTRTSSDGNESATEEAGSDDGELERDQVETTYERGPEGHRVTRRTVHRRVETEDVEEEINEVLPAHAYRTPRGTHPAPVG